MTYNELYLATLGAFALLSAGVIYFSIGKSIKYNLRANKREKKESDQL